MRRPKKVKPEEFFHQTVDVCLASAARNEKVKLITVYPSEPFRSAVVTAFVACPDDMALEVGAAFTAAVNEVFARYHEQVKQAKFH